MIKNFLILLLYNMQQQCQKKQTTTEVNNIQAFPSSPTLPISDKDKPMYKSKLQQLCQRQKWALPTYTCIRDGDDHCPQFKASVVVDGVSFDTPSATSSSKQALNEAAQLAFLHFTCAEVSEDKSVKPYKEELTYKSKLQELCQKQKWALPKYTCIRDGADHCPQFKASVVVHAIAFDTLAACNSYKHALNEVARVAFLHFTSQPSDQRSENVDKKSCGKEVESSKSSEDKSVEHYLQEGFKNKLMTYAQRKGLKKPAYCTEKEGQCFKARVSVGEDWFTSNELCATAEEAETSAAATALLALLTDAFHEMDPCSYKILLERFASDEGFFPPIYKAIRCDDDSVSCTVEVEGEAFHGAAAESEKLAELNAAKAAYTALIERKLFLPRDEVLKLASRFDSAAISDPQEHPTKHGTQVVQDTIGENQETADHSDCMKKAAEMKSYLLCSKIRVFTCMPNMALPKGVVVLPICENRWTMVELEFPNERAVEDIDPHVFH